jgi:hypothetical protein
VFLYTDGVLSSVAVNDPSQTTPLGGTFAGFAHVPSPNDSGQVAFWAALIGSSADICVDPVQCAVFLSSDGVISSVIAAGDTGPAGVGGTIKDIGRIPLINGSGQLTVWTEISNGFSGQSLVRVTEGVMENVAAVGNLEPLPGTGTFSDFINAFGNPAVPAPNNLGQIGFRGELTGGTASEGIFVTDPPPSVVFEEAAVTNGTAPGTGGGTFDSNFDLDINGSGQAVFRDTVSGGTATSGLFRFFAGSPVEAIAVQGDPGDPEGTGGSFLSFGPPVNNDAGYVVATATTTNGDGLFRFFAGSATELAFAGEDAPGLPTTRFFAGFFDPSINNAGDVVARVDLVGGGQALYLFRFFAGSPVLLAATGDIAPDTTGLKFETFSQPTLGDSDVVAVTVTLDDATQAVYRFFAGDPVTTADLLAHETDEAPGFPPLTRFFAGFGESPSVNIRGHVAYQADLMDNVDAPAGQALFRFFAGSSTTRLLALQGDSVPTGVGGDFGAFGDPAINVHGQVVARAGINPPGSASEGLFVYFMETSTSSSVAITEIVLQGQTTPDAADTYGGVTPVFPFIAYSNTARIVYVANLVGGSQGVYIASLDLDEDGILDFLDNCPLVFNTDQNNTDKALAAGGEDVAADDLGNACDDDDDGDGIPDANDLCPVDPDCDGDGFLDGNDGDNDNDGYLDADETAKGSLPLDAGSTPEHCDGVDNDGDTEVDEEPTGADWDIDGDTVKDCLDADVDTDGDGVVNTLDDDDDGDGVADLTEQALTTDELGNCSTGPSHDAFASDFDKDGDNDPGDLLGLFFFSIGQSAGEPFYSKRSDFDGDGDNDPGDILGFFFFFIGTKCHVFTFTNNTGLDVDDITITFSASINSTFSALDSDLDGWGTGSLSAGNTVLDLDRPDTEGDLAAGGTLTVVVNGPSALTVSSCQWTLDGVDQGAC